MTLTKSYLSGYNAAAIIAETDTPFFFTTTVVGNFQVHMVEQVVRAHVAVAGRSIDDWCTGIL